MIMMPNYMNASEAAKVIGCSVATVSRWAERLGIDRKYGNALMLNRAEVKKIRESWHKRAGNPLFPSKNEN
jgi:transposase